MATGSLSIKHIKQYLLYEVAINTCCLVGAVLLLFPVIWCLFSSTGWIKQRNKFIEYFLAEAFTEYFFFIGVFSTKNPFAIAKRLGTQKLGLGDDAGTNTVSELETLQNITTANAERFSDEGISTIAQLA